MSTVNVQVTRSIGALVPGDPHLGPLVVVTALLVDADVLVDAAVVVDESQLDDTILRKYPKSLHSFAHTKLKLRGGTAAAAAAVHAWQ